MEQVSELGGFVVTEQYRGRGIGRALLMAAEGWVRSLGIKKLRVRVRSTRHDAQAFHQRLGFSRTKDQQVLDKRIEPSAYQTRWRCQEKPGGFS